MSTEDRRAGTDTYLSSMGLHYCHKYRNVVRFCPEFCGKCPFHVSKVITLNEAASDCLF